ncbi:MULTISPECIES: hypothetical protein [Tissierellales]|jgi:hypothetical protein|nr:MULTISPECIES: hypothetical protein [Tissierellales]
MVENQNNGILGGLFGGSGCNNDSLLFFFLLLIILFCGPMFNNRC